jgi:hypothetical protein
MSFLPKLPSKEEIFAYLDSGESVEIYFNDRLGGVIAFTFARIILREGYAAQYKTDGWDETFIFSKGIRWRSRGERRAINPDYTV